MSLAQEVLVNWAPIFRGVGLQSADHGRFEVTLDGDLVFSKAALGRHANRGEVVSLIERKVGQPLGWRKS